MNYWIFQSVPERYDLRERIKPGKETTWYATRYRNLMSPNDLVFFWLAGPKEIRGIYGWGKLTSTPHRKPEWDSYGVDVLYEERLHPPISVETIKKTPELENSLILRVPQATNFRISAEEARAIVSLISPDQRPKGV